MEVWVDLSSKFTTVKTNETHLGCVIVSSGCCENAAEYLTLD